MVSFSRSGLVTTTNQGTTNTNLTFFDTHAAGLDTGSNRVCYGVLLAIIFTCRLERSNYIKQGRYDVELYRIIPLVGPSYTSEDLPTMPILITVPQVTKTSGMYRNSVQVPF